MERHAAGGNLYPAGRRVSCSSRKLDRASGKRKRRQSRSLYDPAEIAVSIAAELIAVRSGLNQTNITQEKKKQEENR